MASLWLFILLMDKFVYQENYVWDNTTSNFGNNLSQWGYLID